MSDCRYPPAHAVGDYRNCGCTEPKGQNDMLTYKVLFYTRDGLSYARDILARSNRDAENKCNTILEECDLAFFEILELD